MPITESSRTAHVTVAPAPGAPGGIRTYEELEGGEGRVLSFRPHRYSRADLAPLAPRVQVRAGEAVLERELEDVSRSGVAFAGGGLPPLAADQPLALAVKLDEQVLWSGTARVRWDRERAGRRVVAVSFGPQVLEGDELRLLREVWLPEAAGLRREERAWCARREGSFRTLVAELRLHLEELRDRLGGLEASLPWRMGGERASSVALALVSRLRAEVAADVVAAITEIGLALRRADPAERAADRAFSRGQLQGLLMQAPWMARARAKPLGYAGDFEVMNYLYERDFEGPTLFARTLGYAFMQSAAARAVRSRKELVKGALREVLARSAGRLQPVRILSVAAGPARELQELLRELEELPASVEVVLFDQDKRALDHAFQRLRPLADAKFPGRVRIEFLNEAVKRLLRDPRLFQEVAPFDAVYSAGLFDYFHEPTALRLARNLCAAAAPGGRVLIGNMVDHPHRWVMELHLEWELLYRTRQELLDIGRQAAPGAAVRVLEEASGVNPFIEIAPG